MGEKRKHFEIYFQLATCDEVNNLYLVSGRETDEAGGGEEAPGSSAEIKSKK